MTSQDLLRHHGDVDAAPGLLDFAVNVRLDRPPAWLRGRLAGALDRLGSYPSAADEYAARAAVADRHRRSPDEVLPLAGAAEFFALLPSLRPRLAAIVHPSFTEPEVALRAAGVPVTHVSLLESEGFRLRADAVPEHADLVVLGNPTNPTSVSHSAEVIEALVRPGRIVVVDEAFMDAVPGEPESVARHALPGMLVVRSLTKMWGLAGLRVGYALGEPEVLTALTSHRPHWPVHVLALEALVACHEPGALTEAAEAATTKVRQRNRFEQELAAIPGVRVTGPASAPFLLVRVPNGGAVRARLREGGIAVRRADTFPGLGPDYLRIAVRDPEHNAVLVRALREMMTEG